MKTRKVNTSILIMTLMIAALSISSTSYAQDSLLAQKWNQFRTNLAERIIKEEPVYHTVAFRDNENSLEAWMTDLRTWAAAKVAPTSSPFEEDIQVEEWMTEPYVSRSISCTEIEFINEDEIAVESWMTRPFEVNTEEDIEVEPWMTEIWTQPVEDENIELESWMSSPESW